MKRHLFAVIGVVALTGFLAGPTRIAAGAPYRPKTYRPRRYVAKKYTPKVVRARPYRKRTYQVKPYTPPKRTPHTGPRLGAEK